MYIKCLLDLHLFPWQAFSSTSRQHSRYQEWAVTTSWVPNNLFQSILACNYILIKPKYNILIYVTEQEKSTAQYALEGKMFSSLPARRMLSLRPV